MALAGEELPALGADDVDAADLGSERPEAEIALRVGRGVASARLYFSDLTPEYVKLNSDYTT
jgi:N-acetylglutamate synthase/N-acetylornithine aminotransferase